MKPLRNAALFLLSAFFTLLFLLSGCQARTKTETDPPSLTLSLPAFEQAEDSSLEVQELIWDESGRPVFLPAGWILREEEGETLSLRGFESLPSGDYIDRFLRTGFEEQLSKLTEDGGEPVGVIWYFDRFYAVGGNEGVADTIIGLGESPFIFEGYEDPVPAEDFCRSVCAYSDEYDPTTSGGSGFGETE